MEAYKFETTVQKDGTIRIPGISELANRSVELFIVPKQPDAEAAPQVSVDQFLKKWSGIIEGEDPEALKRDYLRNKYA